MGIILTMNALRQCHLSAWLVIVLLVSNFLPAFGMGGRWFCPDGSLCPRNGGAVAVDHEPETAHAPCCRSRSSRCGVKAAVHRAICSSTECYFVPTARQEEPARIFSTDRSSPTFPPAALLTFPPSLFIRAFRPSTHPLPVSVLLPLSLLCEATPSRAPPLG
jgi:hypothetical protein